MRKVIRFLSSAKLDPQLLTDLRDDLEEVIPNDGCSNSDSDDERIFRQVLTWWRHRANANGVL
jgi:hypothetical protein